MKTKNNNDFLLGRHISKKEIKLNEFLNNRMMMEYKSVKHNSDASLSCFFYKPICKH